MRQTVNTIIDEMVGRQRVIIKTFVKSGTVYSFNDTLRIVPKPIAERMIARRIIVSDDEQAFRLNPSWDHT